MNFTQEQIDTLQLPIRGKRLRLSVLNQDNQTLTTLEGNCIGGSLQKQSNDFVRRTGSIQLAIPRIADADTFLELVDGVTININGKIWLDKNIKIEIGIENYIQPYGVEPQTVWYNFGVCLIDKPVRVFGADSYTMSFNVTDLATKLNGDRGGQLVSLTTVIPRISEYVDYYHFGNEQLIPVDSPTGAVYMTQDSSFIYCGVGSKICVFNKSQSQFVSYAEGSFTYANGIDNDENNVYISSVNGFYVYDKQSQTVGSYVPSPLQATIFSISSDSNNVYCGAGGGRFAIYDKLSGTFGSLIANPFGNNAILSIANDSNNVYCGGGNGSFAIYDKSNGTFGSLIATPFGSNYIRKVAIDGNNIYIVGDNGCFAIYDKLSGTFGSLIETPFGTYRIYSVSFDEHNVFLGGEQGAFSICEKSTWTCGSLLKTPIGALNIVSILQDDNNLYWGGASQKFALAQKISDSVVYTKTRDALSSVISELGGIKNYTIYPIPKKWEILPQDIKMAVGQTVAEILDAFLEILNGWQMYFNNDGVFVVEPIPSGSNDITYPFNLSYNITDTNSVDFNNVRNQVVVYGRSHDISFFTEDATYDNGGNLTLNFEAIDLPKVQIGSTIFGFKNNPVLINGVYFGSYINSLTINVSDGEGGWNTLVSNAPITIYGIDNDDPFSEYPLREEYIYVFRVKEATTETDENDRLVIDFTKPISFELLGKQQIASCIVNGNPESPYYINKGYGAKRSAYGGTVNYFYVELQVSPYTETDDYDITLTDNLGTVQAGDIITFISPNANKTTNVKCSITNKDGTAYATNKSIVTSSDLSTLVEGKFGNDYTIWEMQYDGTGFVLNGICPYANPLIESGGEFDNIYADTLASERAQYDLFLHSNMQNTITLNCVPDYAIDVNYRIKYNSSSALPPDANFSEDFEDRYFITKQITYPLGLDNASQQIDAIEIYDDYNYVGYAYDLPTET